MIKAVNSYSISEVFSNLSSTIYKIPKYQREYTWGIKEWDNLFNDITDNENGYFLGSYICVSTSSIGTPELELIDGQQRFTSIALFITALYSWLLPYKEDGDLDDDEVTDLNNIRNAIANRTTKKENGKKRTTYSPKLILQDQNYNREDFESILFDCGIIDFRSKPAYRGVRRVEKAFNHFDKCIDRYIQERSAEDNELLETEILFELADKFKSAVMVGIEVDSHKDAYMLFESLNHRGIPLSAIDLIKNVLIAEAEGQGLADECYDQWIEGLENVGNDYAVQERFFRQYYNAFREELNKPFRSKSDSKMYPLAYKATRTTLLDIYEKLIRKNYDKFMSDFSEMTEYYAIIVGNSEDDKLYDEALKDLERIQGAPSYLLLLFILSNQECLGIQDKEIKQIIKYLITFFVRRNITDSPPTRRLDKIFIDIVETIKESENINVVDYIRDSLIDVSEDDEVFERKLRGPVYDENDVATRFVLCGIESKHQTREKYSDLWARNNSEIYVWTIEHIFPEGENIPKAWVDMIADGDKHLASEYLQEYAHTLGNLTMTGYNQHLSNMSFEKKKNRKDKNGNEIGYKNGLYLNEDVVRSKKWTIEKIKSRTDKLIEEIMDLYSW